VGLTSPMHIILLLVVVVLLFGAGRISGVMGDVAKGIKSFKKGMSEADEDSSAAVPTAPTLIANRTEADIIAEHEAKKAAAAKDAAA
jgi:sec-independent protein translocase protein TatA